MPTRIVHNGATLFHLSERVVSAPLHIGELLVHNDQAFSIVDIEHWSRKDGGEQRCRLETTVYVLKVDDNTLKMRRERRIQSQSDSAPPTRY